MNTKNKVLITLAMTAMTTFNAIAKPPHGKTSEHVNKAATTVNVLGQTTKVFTGNKADQKIDKAVQVTQTAAAVFSLFKK